MSVQNCSISIYRPAENRWIETSGHILEGIFIYTVSSQPSTNSPKLPGIYLLSFRSESKKKIIQVRKWENAKNYQIVTRSELTFSGLLPESTTAQEMSYVFITCPSEKVSSGLPTWKLQKMPGSICVLCSDETINRRPVIPPAISLSSLSDRQNKKRQLAGKHKERKEDRQTDPPSYQHLTPWCSPDLGRINRHQRDR